MSWFVVVCLGLWRVLRAERELVALSVRQVQGLFRDGLGEMFA